MPFCPFKYIAAFMGNTTGPYGPANFQTAKVACDDLGQKLLTIDSQEEEDYIAQNFDLNSKHVICFQTNGLEIFLLQFNLLSIGTKIGLWAENICVMKKKKWILCVVLSTTPSMLKIIQRPIVFSFSNHLTFVKRFSDFSAFWLKKVFLLRLYKFVVLSIHWSIWLGITDLDVVSVWRTPEGFVSAWLNWYSTEPNGRASGQEERCAVRRPTHKRWWDARCSDMEMYYCEGKLFFSAKSINC